MNRIELKLKALSFEGENWLPIAEYPDYYVSDFGRVASMKYGKIKMLKARIDGRGYHIAALCVNAKAHCKKVHRLVMTEFKGYSDLHIDHIDGVKTNNKLSNLEYVTQRENTARYNENRETTSMYRGVSWFKRDSKWLAGIRYAKKIYFLGHYEIESDAGKAYEYAMNIIEKGLPEGETVRLLKQIKKSFKPNQNQAQLWK